MNTPASTGIRILSATKRFSSFARSTPFTNSIVNPRTGLPTLHPFLWEGDEMMDLGTLGGTLAFVNGINSRGQVAGVSTLAGDQSIHPFLWDQGKLTDLGTLGGNSVEVIGLNDAGEVVGKAQLPGSPALHAFLAKTNDSMIDLGSLEGDPCSVAISINAQAQIVGFSDDCSGNNQHAFLWEDGRITDLNGFVPASSDFTLIQALFINDRGEIAAQGVLLAPGSAFGDACTAHARLCFTGVDEARLDEGIDRINRVLAAWQHNAQAELIADATVADDWLIVVSCEPKTYEVRFDQMPALKKI